MSIGNLKIGVRLGLGFGVLLLLSITMAGGGIWYMMHIAGLGQTIVASDAEKARISLAWLGETKSNAVRAVVLSRSDDPELKALLAPTLEATTKRIAELQKRVDALIDSSEAKTLYDEIGAKRKTYIDIRSAALALRKAGQTADANKMVDEQMVPAIGSYVASIEKFAEFQKERMEASGVDMQASASWGRSLLIVCTLVAAIFGFLLAWWVTRSIARPLSQAVGVAEKIAVGDLTSVVEVRGKDETGMLLRALKDMNESLRKIVGDVRSGTEAIGSGTKQIASGNADLSQRTEEQASSLEETASSMEELTSTVKQNAENAKQANQLALGASAVAVKGGTVVGQVVATMSSINESSKKIVDIISVIDGIAFQTNILALNAAVEAARAGEQGRGFAVVATEVRNLAQRSAAAAKEIKALIGDSVDKVGAGTKLVDEAGKTMEEIVTSVKRVTDIMSEITAASQEQSAGIEQVNQAITQMDEVTQQNAALVEEAAAAAESLEEQAQHLAHAVSVFRLHANDAEQVRSRDTAAEPGQRSAAVTHIALGKAA